MPGERSRGSIRAVGPRSVVVELPGSDDPGKEPLSFHPGMAKSDGARLTAGSEWMVRR